MERLQFLLSMLNSLTSSLQFFLSCCMHPIFLGPPTTLSPMLDGCTAETLWRLVFSIHIALIWKGDANYLVWRFECISSLYGHGFTLLDRHTGVSYAIEVAVRLADEIAIYDNDATIGVTALDINLNKQLLMRESTTSTWRNVAVDDTDVELHYEAAKVALVGQPLKLFHQVELPSMTSECHGPKLQRLSVQVNT